MIKHIELAFPPEEDNSTNNQVFYFILHPLIYRHMRNNWDCNKWDILSS